MPGLFEKTIHYVKMYSTFRDNTTDNCFAFIVLPSSQQRRQLFLSSIQFDFNAEGNVLALRIFYDGEGSSIQKKAQQTINTIDNLKASYGPKKEWCTFDAHNKSLKVELTMSSIAYLGALFDILTRIYYLKDEFAEEIKKQLIAQDYLAKEYKRLGGRVLIEDKSCVLM